MADTVIHSRESLFNSLIEEFAIALASTKLKNTKLFVLNFLIRKSELISEINISDTDLEKFKWPQEFNTLAKTNKYKDAASLLRDKLREFQSDEDFIEITIAPEKEPSLESIREGLIYKGNNDSSYNDVPSTYVISNY